MPTWDELTEGTSREPMTFGPLSITDFVRYQGASGDMNPLHHDYAFAEKSGFEAPVAVGMFTAGVMNAWAASWLGPENLRSTRMRWKKPAFVGSVLTVSGTIAKRYQQGSERRVDVELTVTDTDGDVSVQGWMSFVVAEES